MRWNRIVLAGARGPERPEGQIVTDGSREGSAP